MREEQQPPIDEITELAPDVRRLQLPIDMPGLGHVNCYILDDDRGAALVDPGLPGPRAYKALQAGLQRAGLKVKDIHTVVITHSHPDHFGAVGRLQRETDLRVITHRDFRLWWDRDEEDTDAVHNVDRVGENDAVLAGDAVVMEGRTASGPGAPTPWGGAPYKMDLRRRFGYWVMRKGLGGRFASTPRPTDHVVDEDALHLARREWRAVHTPGHTTDHLCLLDPESGLLISGDHILPTITPHISGLGPTTDALTSYFDSLDKTAEISGVTKVLPAHGLAFDGLSGRAKDIKRHHEDRLQILRDASDDLGRATVLDYMQQLFKERSWGPMAESETFAHLEHLRRDGEVTVTRNEAGLLEYDFS